MQVQQSPPYYVYGLAALTSFSMPFGHVAILNYAYKIMPPTLAATVGSLVNIIEYSLFKSMAPIIGGQLIDKMGISLPQLFRISSFFSLGLGLIYIIIYYLVARPKERNLIEMLDKNYPERLTRNKMDINNEEVLENTKF